MAELVYLEPGDPEPDLGDDAPWLRVEADSDGRFFGSGFGLKPSGERVFYLSLPEDDLDLESALRAAKEWAAKYGVPVIRVYLTP